MKEQPQLAYIKFPKDAYIIVEGERNAEQFYIIREGKVAISRDVQVVAEGQGNVLGPGDFFGVVSTMSSHSHIETAHALTDAVLISVRQDQFSQLIQDNAPVAIKILLFFSKRMRYLNEALTKITLKKNAALGVEHLFDVAEYYSNQKQFNQAYYAYNQYIKYCPQGEKINKARDHLKRISSLVKTKKIDFKPGDLTRNYPKDVMIFAEGELGEDVFIIKTGLVKIAKVVGDGEVLLAVLKTGDIFGEMAVLDSSPRVASAISFDECQLMVLNQANFQQMINTQPQLIARLTTLLAERIWLIYKQLANTRIFDPLGRLYDMLYIQLEKKRVDFNTKRNFQFDFGIKELIGMVGLSQKEGSIVMQKLLQSRQIVVIQDKIRIENVLEFSRQAMYYRKAQEAEARRKR
jgi:CRP-like cAMP-binding protein